MIDSFESVLEFQSSEPLHLFHLRHPYKLSSLSLNPLPEDFKRFSLMDFASSSFFDTFFFGEEVFLDNFLFSTEAFLGVAFFSAAAFAAASAFF
jgi:hypothetical protein